MILNDREVVDVTMDVRFNSVIYVERKPGTGEFKDAEKTNQVRMRLFFEEPTLWRLQQPLYGPVLACSGARW